MPRQKFYFKAREALRQQQQQQNNDNYNHTATTTTATDNANNNIKNENYANNDNTSVSTSTSASSIDKNLQTSTESAPPQKLQACTLEDMKDQHIVEASLSDDQDVILRNLNNCTIEFQNACGAAHIKNIHNCKIYLPSVRGSIMIHDSSKSKFFTRSHQLRIHTTLNSIFCIYVTSDPVIEDCDQLSFCSLSKLPSFSFKNNLWTNVKDFNWLRSDQPSPHWKESPELNEDGQLEAWIQQK
eukprot:Awhi_evm1s15777